MNELENRISELSALIVVKELYIAVLENFVPPNKLETCRQTFYDLLDKTRKNDPKIKAIIEEAKKAKA